MKKKLLLIEPYQTFAFETAKSTVENTLCTDGMEYFNICNNSFSILVKTLQIL